MLSAAFLAVGCNGLLGNDERVLAENTSGSESGSGGTNSTTGSSGAGFGEGGLAGMAPDAGGAAGVAEGGGAGEGESGGTGGTGESGGTGGVGGVGGTSTSSTTGVSNTTGEPCECTPPASEPADVACGNCGTATVERLCGDDCQWGEYGAPGACMNEGACAPNAALQVTGHCSNGGWRFDTSTCGADCQPGTWTRGDCEYGQNSCTGCACMADCAGSESRCFWIDCDEAAARAECVGDADVVCGTDTFVFVEWLPN